MAKQLIGMVAAVVLVGQANGQTLGRVDCLELADANGKAVGKILGGTSSISIFNGSTITFPALEIVFEANGIPVLLLATRDDLLGFLGDGLLFESSDCTGTAYRPVFGSGGKTRVFKKPARRCGHSPTPPLCLQGTRST